MKVILIGMLAAVVMGCGSDYGPASACGDTGGSSFNMCGVQMYKTTDGRLMVAGYTFPDGDNIPSDSGIRLLSNGESVSPCTTLTDGEYVIGRDNFHMAACHAHLQGDQLDVTSNQPIP
jgi:hypothetical protein